MPDPFEEFESWGKSATATKPADNPLSEFEEWGSKDPFPDQSRRYEEARQFMGQRRGAEKEFGFGLGLRLRRSDLQLPFQGVANSIARGIAGVENPHELHKRAQDAFAKGEATDEQLARLAYSEYEQARNKSLGTPAAIGQGLAHAAPVVSEALAGGQAVKGIAGAVGLGGRLAPAATTAGRMAQSAGIQAAATPLTPGLWLDESQQRAAENGGKWYEPKNVAAPMVKAAFQNAIMGHLGEGTKGLGIAKRIGLGAALMPAEQAGADALTTLAEKGWKEAGMDEKWATKTEWGTVGQFVRGESGEGWKQLATQATLGGLFAGFHGQKADPVINLTKAVDSLAEAGVPKELAGRVINEAMNRPPETIKNPEVKAYVESIIDLKPADAPKTRSAGPPPEPAQPPVEAKKTAPAKPQTASQALEALFRNDAPVDPNRPPDALPRPIGYGEKFVPEFGNREVVPEKAKPEPKKRGFGKKELVLPKPPEPVRVSEDAQRPNVDLEDFFSAPATPKAEPKPAGDLRANSDLEDFMSRPVDTKAEQTVAEREAKAASDFDRQMAEAMGMEIAPPRKGVDVYEPAERRVAEGPVPDPDRRRPTGLKLGAAEPVTIDNARVSEIADLDRFGKDHFRIAITDNTGAKVGEVRIGAIGDTLHAPVGFADGLEFGKGRGKDQPFGSAEIMSLVEQVAALDPTAKKLVFTPSKGRIRAGVEKEFNLDKIRERVAKRAEKEAAKPVEEPKQEQKEEAIRVYHGSAEIARRGGPEKFTGFTLDIGPTGGKRRTQGMDSLGVWFTTNKEHATDFGRYVAIDKAGKETRHEGHVVEADITLKKPLVFDSPEAFRKWQKEVSKRFGERHKLDGTALKKELVDQGYDGITIRGGGGLDNLKGDPGDWYLVFDPASPKIVKEPKQEPPSEPAKPVGDPNANAPNPDIPHETRQVLTPDQEKAVKRFSNFGSHTFNKGLRQGLHWLDPDAIESLNSLKAAADAAPVLGKPITVFRGIDFKFIDDKAARQALTDNLERGLKTGEPVEFKEFQSSSTRPTGVSEGSDSRFDIKVRKGIDAKPYSAKPDEWEMIIPPGSFKVTGKEGNVWKLEQILPGESREPVPENRPAPEPEPAPPVRKGLGPKRTGAEGTPARRGLGRKTAESPRPEPVVDRVPEPVKSDLPNLKEQLSEITEKIGTIKRQGERMDNMAIARRAKEAENAASAELERLKEIDKTFGKGHHQKKAITKDIKTAQGVLNSAEAEAFRHEKNTYNDRLEELALDESQPEFVRLAAAHAAGQTKMSHESVFKDIQKHVEGHLKSVGKDPAISDEVTSELIRSPLIGLERHIGSGEARTKTRQVRKEAVDFIDSLDQKTIGASNREMRREAESLYTDDELSGFKKKWGEVNEKNAQERIQAEKAERESKLINNEADSVIEKARKGMPTGEVSPQVMKEVVNKLQMQDFEWRDTVVMPKGTKPKKIIEIIGKNVGGRWALPKTVTERGWATDTKYAVKATPEMIEHAKKLGHDKIEGRSPPINDILPKNKEKETKPAKMVGQQILEQGADSGRILIESKDGFGIFDVDYIADVLGVYPDAEIRLKKDKSGYNQAIFYKGNEPVGLVMGLGGHETKPTISKKPAVELGQALEKGKFSEKDAVETYRGVAVGIDDARAELITQGNRIKGGDNKTEYGDREYKTKAQANKAAKKLLEYSHGSDEDGNPVFIPKGGKLAKNSEIPSDSDGGVGQFDQSGDFGRAMTPEERAAGQVGGGAYGTDELPKVASGDLNETALANAKVDEERARNGLPPLMAAARRANEAVWDQAMVKLGRDPNVSADLVNELAKKPRATTVEENALLLHRKIQFNNEYERTIRQANEAARKGDMNEFDRIAIKADELLGQIDRLDKVTRATGTEWGRAGQFRRQLAAEDYSLGMMMGRAAMEKRAPLTTEEVQKVTALHEKIAALEGRLRDFEAKDKDEVIDLEPADQRGMLTKVKDWLGGIFKAKPGLGKKPSKAWEFADRLEADAAKEIMAKYGPGKLFSGFDPTGIPALAKYTAAKIIKGGLTFSDFSTQIVARFGDAVKPHLKDIWSQAEGHANLGKMDKTDVQVDLKKTKADYAEMVAKFKRKNQSPIRKVWEGIKEGNNLVRILQTSYDVSGIGRQGGPLALANPTKVPAAIREMIDSIKSERGYERNQMNILNRRNARDYELGGLEFTDHNADPTRQEESLAGRFTGKIHGVAASARAFNGFLNRLRADVFDAMSANITSRGPERVVELKAIGNFINAMTGRGKTGHAKTDAAVAHLGHVFYSPRHAISRFQVLSGQPFWGAGTWKAKKLIAQQYAKYAIGMGAVYGLAKMLLGKEAEIEKDPRSSDFGKIRIGRTRLDPLAGFSQSAVVGARLLAGESKMPGTNEVKDLRGPGHKFKDPTSIKVAGQFVRNKLSPLAGEISDKFFPEYTPPGDTKGPLNQMTGEKKGTLGWGIRQADKFLPLSSGDVYDAFKEHGYTKAAAFSLLSLLGWGSQVHSKEHKK